ncbi:MAG: elongation factor P lysine(34) lysyltransferase, partial [Thiotrichales bacterium]
GDIYQICKSFRQEEMGSWHNVEFTMLEWYRVGFSGNQLMEEVDELLQYILRTQPSEKYSYLEIFEKYLEINPHTISTKTLWKIVKQHYKSIDNLHDGKRDTALQLLMTKCIEPNLGQSNQACIIYDYPVTQSALAKIKTVDGNEVSARFEFYVDGIELANGYQELTDYEEHETRYRKDIALRKKANSSVIPKDAEFMAAMQHGLPECAGVALGMDRLIALALQKSNIKGVTSF